MTPALSRARESALGRWTRGDDPPLAGLPLVYLLAAVLDTATTAVGVALLGRKELNPVARYLFGQLGILPTAVILYSLLTVAAITLRDVLARRHVPGAGAIGVLLAVPCYAAVVLNVRTLYRTGALTPRAFYRAGELTLRSTYRDGTLALQWVLRAVVGV